MLEPWVRSGILRSLSSGSGNKRQRWKGWRFGVVVATASTFLVMILNILLTIVAATLFARVEGIEGVVTGFVGSCDRVDNMVLWLHLVINAISSALLSASNYTMQCLVSPTREEVDIAHRQAKRCDIGVPSLKNLVRIRKHRAVLWLLLATSSIPIHLIYNSSVFKTLSANYYTIGLATEDFLKGEPLGNRPLVGMQEEDFHIVNGSSLNGPDPEVISALKELQGRFANGRAYTDASRFQNLTNHECIRYYSQDYVADRSNVLLITNEHGQDPEQTVFSITTPTYSAWYERYYAWICDSDLERAYCDVQGTLASADSWRINGKPISYCMSELTKENCKLQFSVDILVVVVICNAIKVVCMFMTLWKEKRPALVTVGDAIASYLDEPDHRTKGRCLTSRKDADQVINQLSDVKDDPSGPHDPEPIEHTEDKRHRWFTAASARRWTCTVLLCIAALGTTSFFLANAIHKVKRSGGSTDASSLFSMGFGAVDSRTLISKIKNDSRNFVWTEPSAKELHMYVLVANLPQVIVSFLYLLYNGLVTSMHLAFEWSTYAVQRKGLRVTTPHGKQRNTYWLQLPYTYGIPLIMASTLLHWLFSQALFLVRIEVYENGVEQVSEDITRAGFSILPIVCCILLGGILLIAVVALGFRKFASATPVAGSCSFAIAAACHAPVEDVDASVLPVQWGDTQPGEAVGHCCFTSQKVSPLVTGRLYAGQGTVGEGAGDVRKRQ